jgi:hypothetical protein
MTSTTRGARIGGLRPVHPSRACMGFRRLGGALGLVLGFISALASSFRRPSFSYRLRALACIRDAHDSRHAKRPATQKLMQATATASGRPTLPGAFSTRTDSSVQAQVPLSNGAKPMATRLNHPRVETLILAGYVGVTLVASLRAPPFEGKGFTLELILILALVLCTSDPFEARARSVRRTNGWHGA